MLQNKKQTGAVLVVSLVLLLVMSLIGITTMSITSGELKVSASQQAHNNAYEAALSLLESVKRSSGINWLNFDRSATQAASAAGVDFTGSAVITYEHCIKGAEGNSLTIESQDGDSSSNFGRIVQEVVATGNAMKGGQLISTAVQVNGVSIKAASCP